MRSLMWIKRGSVKGIHVKKQSIYFRFVCIFWKVLYRIGRAQQIDKDSVIFVLLITLQTCENFGLKHFVGQERDV